MSDWRRGFARPRFVEQRKTERHQRPIIAFVLEIACLGPPDITIEIQRNIRFGIEGILVLPVGFIGHLGFHDPGQQRQSSLFVAKIDISVTALKTGFLNQIKTAPGKLCPCPLAHRVQQPFPDSSGMRAASHRLAMSVEDQTFDI